jgi:hypothetical protein
MVVDVSSWGSGRGVEWLVGCQSLEVGVQVVLDLAPTERAHGRVGPSFEADQSLFERVEVGEDGGLGRLALLDGEADLD